MLTILKQHSLLIIALIYVLLSTHPSSAQKPVQDTVLRAGAAISKITPPVGSIMGNSYGLTLCEGVHDDLYARTIVLDHSGTKAVFIALDLISIPYVIVMETRKLIAQQTGIPVTSIIMTATHVHAGPQMNPMFLDAVGGLPKQKSGEYLRKLPEMIAESVLLARERR